MQAIDKSLSDITGSKSTNLDLAQRALMISNDNNRIVMEIVLVENRRLVEPLLAARSRNSKEITKLIEESESRCKSAKEKQVLSEVKRTRQPYVESFQRAIHLLVDERKHDEAEMVMVNETLPALHTHHAAWEQFVEFQRKALEAAVKQAQDDYANTRRLASLLIGLAVVLAAGIALFATHETAQEIAARTYAEKEVAKLNASLEERVTQRTGELSVANEELTVEIDKRKRAQESHRQEVIAREDVEIDLRRSDERMRMAVEAARIGFWDWDVIRGEHVWSDICKELLGLRPENTANFQMFMNSVHPDDREMMGNGINAAMEGKTNYSLEFRVVWPDGSVHWQAAKGRAFYDETGRTTRMAGISMDIDERKHAEERLYLQVAALEAAANSILITDSYGTIVWVNHAFTTMTGYSKEEAVGKNPRLLKSGRQLQRHYSDMWSTISSGKVWHGEFVNRRKDGTNYTEEMTITPVTRDGVGDYAHFVAIMQDVTERTDAERATNLLAAIVDSSADAIISKSLEGVITSWNKGAEQMFGYTAKEAVGQHVTLIIPPDRRDEEATILERVKRGDQIKYFETFRVRKDGTPLYVSLTFAPVKDGVGRVVGVSTLARDITEQKRGVEALQQAEEKYRAIFEDAVVGIFRSTTDGRYIDVNPSMARMLGYDSPHEMVASITDISRQVYVDPNRREELKRLLREQATVKNFECAVYRKDGSKMWFSANMRAVYENGAVVGYEGTNEDITDRKVAEERVQYLAYYDALMGLPNRTLLQDRLTKAIADARRQTYKIALLFLDLDKFKDINDSLGHSVGDLFLQEVAERLKRFAREQDTVARLGGDEFLIMLTHLTDTPDAAVAAERLMDAMNPEFVIQGHSLHVSCSIGISIFPEHGADCEMLIKNADAAMYSAKTDGRNNFRFFTEDMNAQAVERLTLESSLRSALAKEQLFLMYQPQMDIATGKISGLEALLRWQHPELGLVPPDKFIRIAENSGLIVPIGEWVLRTACCQARKWQDEGFSAVTVAVNVSAIQFRQENFCGLVRRVLHETGLAPQYLELELTESLLLTNADVMLSVVQELKAMGLTLAIDDFGTGYSSFSYLRQFQVSKLKIDGSFIRDVAVNPDDAAITMAIISMAKSLNLKVIAEGVETEAQMSFLRTHHCDEIQGYYFSQPLSVDKVANKLRVDQPNVKESAQASGKQA